MALTEIILPSDVKNITEENNCFYLRFSDVELGYKVAIATNRFLNDDGGVDEIEAECLTSDTECSDFKLYSIKGCFVSPQQLLGEMQNIFRRRYGKILKQSNADINIGYESNSKRVTVDIESPKKVKIIFPKSLAEKLGVNPSFLFFFFFFFFFR